MKDYLTEQGALSLASTIRSYWSRADKPVKVWTERQKHGVGYIWVVRSNIVFGGL